MTTLPGRAGALFVLVLTLGLSGCVGEPAPSRLTALPPEATPRAAPSATNPASDDPVVDVACSDGAAYLTGEAASLRLSGPCERVEVSGELLEIDIAEVAVGALVVRGESVSVRAGALGSVLIEGQNNTLLASSIGSTQVRGDDNALDITGDLGPLTIQGGGNTVVAATLGAVTEEGAGNSVTSR